MKRYKLLFVDDERETLELIQSYLETFYFVDICSDANEALQLIKNNNYDLLVFDINMPILDGFSLCKKVKYEFDLQFTPVMFLSAYNDIEHITKGYEVGASDYLFKPLKVRELQLRIDHQIKVAKKEEQAFLENIELNRQIQFLTDELLLTEEKVLLEESSFAKKEDIFSANNERIKENKIKAELFNEKIMEIQKKLQKQNELLKKTKKLLG